MTEEVHAELVRRGLGPSISTIESYVEMIKNSLDSRDIIAVLNAMGIEENEANVASARTHMIRAGATASLSSGCSTKTFLHHQIRSTRLPLILAHRPRTSPRS